MKRKEYAGIHYLKEDLLTCQLQLMKNWIQVTESLIESCDIHHATLIRLMELSQIFKLDVAELINEINEEDKLYLTEMGKLKE